MDVPALLRRFHEAIEGDDCLNYSLSCKDSQRDVLPSASDSTNVDLTVKSIRPLNYGDYLSRLSTFRVSGMWFGKSISLDACNCSRRGWVNCGSDKLHCNFCETTVDFSGRDKDTDDSILVSSHEEFCGWRVNSCPEDFRYFQYCSLAEKRQSFLIRARAILASLSSSEADQPTEGLKMQLCTRLMEAMKLTSDVSATASSAVIEFSLKSSGETLQLFSELQNSSKSLLGDLELSSNDATTAAVSLALTGWTSVSTGRLGCEHCFREFTLSSFASGRVLEPLGQHRHYCPWVTCRATENPGWETVVNELFPVIRADRDSLCDGAGSAYKRIRLALDAVVSLPRYEGKL